MIIFTVTNTVTSQIYVGSTRNDLEAQWERMVAAAEQNLDYPLYRDIRTHGCDAFTREIYDMADSRQELAELEQDAVDSLNAISLRGHKTSTVVIKKKAPVRRKKSEAEKELLDLLDTFASDASDDLPLEGNESKDKTKETTEAKGRVIKAETPAQPVIQQQTSAPRSTAKPAPKKAEGGKSSFDAVAAAKAILAQAAKEQEEKAAAAKSKPLDPKRTSRTTGNVKVEVSIDDTINAQLAAITAAVDGVLAGNSDAASQLETQTRTVEVTPVAAESKPVPAAVEANSAMVPATPVETAPVVEAAPEPAVAEPPKPVLSKKEMRIMEAMERHREIRAKRTSEVVDAEKNQIQELLAELNNRVAAMPVQDSVGLH